ncbi:hypothetical protein GQ57_14440 [Burkholderia sp. MSh2]|nr:hypothetical protein GQ57_14440 [Burkholderia sp. MSh2]
MTCLVAMVVVAALTSSQIVLAKRITFGLSARFASESTVGQPAEVKANDYMTIDNTGIAPAPA